MAEQVTPHGFAQSMSSIGLVALPFGGRALSRAGIRLTHLWRHGLLPRLDEPVVFNEWVQHRKLHDRDPRLPMLADKVAVKAWVADRLGPAWIIPTLWHGRGLPAEPVWPTPFVVKARHGCNQSRFVFDEPGRGGAEWDAVRRAARRWSRSRYGGWLSEWLYRDIPRGVLVEPFVGVDGALPVDWKFHVFAGRVEYVQIHLGRGERHRWIVFDRAWRRVSAATADPDPARPATLPAMIAAAEQLGRGFTYVRVDLYDGATGPLFGEMTFYPGSGLHRFDPVSLDRRLGEDWRRALMPATVATLAA